MTSFGKPTSAFVILLICLYFMWFYGLTNLKGAPIGNDEFNTIARIRQLDGNQPFSIPETLDNLAAISPDHGPLYFVLMNLWGRVAGADLFSLRLPSVFFALLALAACYRIARLGAGESQGVTAVALLVFLSFFLHYTHVARMYTLLALVAGGVIWSYWKASHSRSPVKAGIWLLLFVSSALITYIHYSGVILLAAIGLYHLLFVRKRRRWWRVSALMALAGMMFLFWLPVAIDGMSASSVVTAARLPLLAALGAGFTVFSNGIAVLPVIAGVLILRYRKRLNAAQRYILLILLFSALFMLTLNEFTPLLVEDRLRYLTFIALPVVVALAYAFRLLPAWKPLRIVLFCGWIGASFAFASASAFDVYTNRRALKEDQLVHYQAFQYDLSAVPAYDLLIMSVHQRAPAVWKTLEYYRAILDRWRYVVHLTTDERGQALLQSGIPPLMTRDSIAEDFDGIWVIHNPAQTNLNAMDVYRNWLLAHFKPCKRFIDQPNNVIELYLKLAIPCELITASKPVALRYENGMELANVMVERSPDALDVRFWWAEIQPNAYSFSLQLFDQRAEKALSQDAVIWRQPFDTQSLDISTLPAGDYALKLVVYDYETGASQSGALIGSGQRFDREVEIARFTVGA